MLSSSIPRGLDDSTSERSALVVIEDAKGGQPAKVTDKKMAKLIDLTKKSDTEKSTEAILQIVQEEAPNLLSGLAMSNNRAIARSIEVRAYLNDEVVFRQNDAPDAYYTVLRGAVSIYALQSSATEESGDEENNRKEYGKFLVQLKSGAGFGELSFQGDYNHTPRNAGIVSDGIGLMESSVTFEEKPGDKIGEGGNVCILLLIPEECYMREMYALHASKNKTKEKINFLKKSFLFSTWSMDQLVKLAYAIKRKDFEKGGLLAKQGDRADNIFMVIKGKIRVQISSESHLTDDHGSKVGVTNKLVEIAELGENDIFGLVEGFDNKRKMKRTGLAVVATEVYVCSLSQFTAMVSALPKTLMLVQKVVQKRKDWEKLRTDYAKAFQTMKCSLPNNATEMSKYSLSKESAMSESELKDLKEKKTQLFQFLREARSSYRAAVTKIKAKNHAQAVKELAKAEEQCRKAMAIANSINEDDLKAQAQDIMDEVVEQLKVQTTRRDGGEVEEEVVPPANYDRSRRGSVILVAMRRRTLSEETSEEVRERRMSETARIADERSKARVKKSFPEIPSNPLSPLSPDSEDSRQLSRSNRRRSIAELANKAGLKEEFGKLDEKRRGSSVELGSSPNGNRRGKLKNKKEDSFYKLLQFPAKSSKPTKPESLSPSRRGSGASANEKRRKRSISEPKSSIRKSITEAGSKLMDKIIGK
ncbi:hypothetical protein TrST_g3172 [Triparma strigata]|uniref:Cyclic nucleotide-binding domain-containing protein n=1 Tax=Triparma strigata TaxID=1606541 RepID=A0A9W7AGR0_9STRA|nr:hypothetical protein TrST_g3172 [Triparma strigata]